MKSFGPTLLLLLATSVCHGKAGPVIPRPKQSVGEVVAIATKHFLGEKNLSKSEAEWRGACIVLAVTYDTPHARHTRCDKSAREADQGQRDDEWSWFVTFVHPAANDVSFTYRVLADGSIREFERTI